MIGLRYYLPVPYEYKQTQSQAQRQGCEHRGHGSQKHRDVRRSAARRHAQLSSCHGGGRHGPIPGDAGAGGAIVPTQVYGRVSI